MYVTLNILTRSHKHVLSSETRVFKRNTCFQAKHLFQAKHVFSSETLFSRETFISSETRVFKRNTCLVWEKLCENLSEGVTHLQGNVCCCRCWRVTCWKSWKLMRIVLINASLLKTCRNLRMFVEISRILVEMSWD